MDHVFTVEDCENCPGRIVAIFDNFDAAADWMTNVYPDSARIECRTVYSDAPPNARYNE